MGFFVVTISGKDAGGFVFENVFHVQNVYAGANTPFKQAGDLASYVIDNIVPSYLGAMNDNAEILAVSGRCIDTSGSFTNTKPAASFGTRPGVAYPGAVQGRLVFIPSVPPLRVSSFYVAGSCEGDFVNDIILSTYQTMLEALGDAFMLIDGSDATYAWQLIQFHLATTTSTDIDEYYVSPNPTTLNKRMRA